MNNVYVRSIVETCMGTGCPETVDAARRIFKSYGLEQPTNCDTLEYIQTAAVGVENHRMMIRVHRLLNTIDKDSMDTFDKLTKIEEILS